MTVLSWRYLLRGLHKVAKSAWRRVYEQVIGALVAQTIARWSKNLDIDGRSVRLAASIAEEVIADDACSCNWKSSNHHNESYQKAVSKQNR